LTVVDLLDHFALLEDPRDQRWVEHPAAAVLALCAAVLVAGMRSFTAIAGWIADAPPRLLHRLYDRLGKPPLTPSKGTIWQVVTNSDAAGIGNTPVLALTLFHGQGYRSVWRELTHGEGDDAPAPSSPGLSQARRRVGPAPLAQLFTRLRGPRAAPGTVGAFLGRPRLVS
jgi:hypothetical protein